MKKYLLGIDIGTTGAKIGLFESNGSLAGLKRNSYITNNPKEDYSEQKPNDWWNATKKGIREIIYEKNINPEKIKGIGVSSMTTTMLPLDKEGNPLYPAVIWPDRRAKKECKQIKKKVGKDKILNITGNNIKLNLLAPKLLWFKNENPNLYEKTRVFLQANGYINYKLTNNFTMDISNSELSLLANKNSGKWEKNIFKRLDLDKYKMPKIFNCTEVIGAVTKEASEETNLMEGTPVIAGGNDTAVSFLGLNVTKPGEAGLEIGHAANLGICLKRTKSSDISDLYHHVIPNTWIFQIYTPTSGASLKWFKENFAKLESQTSELIGKSSYYLLDKEAQKVKCGSNGVIFLPYLEGVKFNSKAKGIIYGLTTSTTKQQVVRALLEGCAMAVKRNMINLEKITGHKIPHIYLGGGASNSCLWAQIHSDILNKKIIVPKVKDATTLGSALLAGIGTKILPKDISGEDIVSIETSYFPNKENNKIYNEIYNKFLNLIKIYK